MEIRLPRAGLVKKLYLIYSLNVADWICTVILLSSGGFFEANPLAGSFIGDISAGFAVKCGLALAVVILIAGALTRLDGDQLYIVDCFISFVLAFYTVICLIHIVNFILLFLSIAT